MKNLKLEMSLDELKKETHENKKKNVNKSLDEIKRVKKGPKKTFKKKVNFDNKFQREEEDSEIKIVVKNKNKESTTPKLMISNLKNTVEKEDLKSIFSSYEVLDVIMHQNSEGK
jgi:hypothetical protein